MLLPINDMSGSHYLVCVGGWWVRIFFVNPNISQIDVGVVAIDTWPILS